MGVRACASAGFWEGIREGQTGEDQVPEQARELRHLPDLILLGHA